MFRDIRVGSPVQFGSLAVFPLFTETVRPIDYLLSDEGIEAGTVSVSEISQEGSVPALVVENKDRHRILFLEGEELRGAKQNRILNTTVLVAAGVKVTIPVSCVEAGRWRRNTAHFMAAKTISPYRLRHGLKKSVTLALKEERGYGSDQGRVWEDVRIQQEALGVVSGTGALADTYGKYETNIAEAQEALTYVPGARGLVVTLGPNIVTADLFDQPATCEKVWGRLVSGMVLDALAQGEAGGSPLPEQVTQFLDEVNNAAWTSAKAVGEGEERRAEFSGKVGSALLLDGSLVYASVIAGVA
jgi:hypothetical protein